MKKHFILLLLLFLCSGLVFAEEPATFESFYKESSSIGLWGWSIAVGIAVASGAIIFFTGGTASPIVVSIGSWLGGFMGLSGAAATNAGLALLGGGSIASGGLGVAGGAALLTAVFTFGTEVVIDYTITIGVSKYQYSRLVTQSKDMTTLPIPTNDDGSDAYEKAIKMLAEIDKDSIISSNDNQKIITETIAIIKNDKALKSRALTALLYFIANDYQSAKKHAKDAINVAKTPKNKNTLPEFIYAASSLYDKDFDFELINKHFKDALINEPNNKLIPLMFSIYLDRISLRLGSNDLSEKSLLDIFAIMQSAKLKQFKTQNYTILLARYFILLKQNQQKIASLADTLNDTIKESHITLKIVKNALNGYGIVLKDANMVINNCKKCKFDKFQSKKLLADYKNDEKRLSKLVNKLEKHQKSINTNKMIIIGVFSTFILLLIVLIFSLKRRQAIKL